MKIILAVILSVSIWGGVFSQTPDSPVAYTGDSVKDKDSDDEPEYSIFPNPSSNFIKVRSKGTPPDAVSIHDIAGTKLMEDRSGRAMNIYSLPKGIYFVYVRTGNRTEKIRFEKL